MSFALSHLTRCHGCGARIRWIRTALGQHLMPLDAELYTSSDPKVVLFDLEGNRVLPSRLGEAASGYVAHFGTCLEAGRYRKPNRRR